MGPQHHIVIVIVVVRGVVLGCRIAVVVVARGGVMLCHRGVRGGAGMSHCGGGGMTVRR